MMEFGLTGAFVCTAVRPAGPWPCVLSANKLDCAPNAGPNLELTMTTHDTLRVIRFRPYLKGQGPVFRLKTWDTGRTGLGDKSLLGYRLSIGETKDQNVLGNPAVWTVLFEGEDFGCSPMHAIDSDETIAAIMGFLTLRPGDTDAEYFDDYTDQQREYCDQHAEALSCNVSDRFGER